MVSKNINDMSMPMGDMSDEFKLLFAYQNDEDKNSQCPVFMNLKDDFFVAMLGRMIYDYGFNHIGELIQSNMTDKSKFMYSIDPNKFKNAIVPSELAKLRDILFLLINLPMMEIFRKAYKPICIAISTETTGRAVNMTWMNDNEIRFDVEIK